jgi:hypothetical protein
MVKQANSIPPALKHAGYSGLTLLPGEDPAEFEKLHNELIVEYSPQGVSEEHLVRELARLIWRKQHVSTYRLASEAAGKSRAMYGSLYPLRSFPMLGLEGPAPSAEEIKSHQKKTEERLKAELGWAFDLVNLDAATIEYLMTELSLAERIDGMIDRCLKRLLFIRGLKSISGNAATGQLEHQPKRLASAKQK